MFLIPKEISSENKLWKSIYIKDFIIILGTFDGRYSNGYRRWE